MLDPSIPAPDVIDWSEDCSFQESPLCAEGACPEQSQSLALISPADVASTECGQLAEAVEADRTLAQARSPVATAKRNRGGLFPRSNAPTSRKCKGKGKLKGQTEGLNVSPVAEAEVVISGDIVLRDSRKKVSKDRLMDLARVTWRQLGVVLPN